MAKTLGTPLNHIWMVDMEIARKVPEEYTAAYQAKSAADCASAHRRLAGDAAAASGCESAHRKLAGAAAPTTGYAQKDDHIYLPRATDSHGAQEWDVFFKIDYHDYLKSSAALAKPDVLHTFDVNLQNELHKKKEVYKYFELISNPSSSDFGEPDIHCKKVRRKFFPDAALSPPTWMGPLDAYEVFQELKNRLNGAFHEQCLRGIYRVAEIFLTP